MRRCDFKKKLVDQAALRYAQFGLENFERGEIVSPLGCIASKGSGCLNLATPDARHRRPLKFFFFMPLSVKAGVNV